MFYIASNEWYFSRTRWHLSYRDGRAFKTEAMAQAYLDSLRKSHSTNPSIMNAAVKEVG